MSPTKPTTEATGSGTDRRRAAALRTAVVMALVAVGIYAAFFLRAILNS